MFLVESRQVRPLGSGIDIAPVTAIMLLFEFFPAFVAIVCVVAGVSLFMMNLEADKEVDGREDHSAGPAEAGHYDHQA